MTDFTLSAHDKTTNSEPLMAVRGQTPAQREAARLTHLFMDRHRGIMNGDQMYRDILRAIQAGEERGNG